MVDEIANALDNLRIHQRQLDADGCEVGVSRQALNEVIASHGGLQIALEAAERTLAEQAGGVKGEWHRADGDNELRAYIVHAPEDDYYGTGPDRLQFHPLAQHDMDNGYRQTSLFTRPSEQAVTDEPARKFSLGDRVTKTKGSSWTGRVVGFYSTALNPVGYCVESETETGSVQIYPETALELKPE